MPLSQSKGVRSGLGEYADGLLALGQGLAYLLGGVVGGDYAVAEVAGLGLYGIAHNDRVVRTAALLYGLDDLDLKAQPVLKAAAVLVGADGWCTG